MLEGTDAGERRKVLDRVVARLLQQEHVVAVGLVVAEDDRVAVRLGASDAPRADCARGAGHILDDHVLPEGLADLLADDAGNRVGRSAGRVGDDELDHAARKRLCPGRADGKRGAGQKVENAPESAARRVKIMGGLLRSARNAGRCACLDGLARLGSAPP